MIMRNKTAVPHTNVIDDYNRQALAIEADFSMPGDLVVRYLERVIHDQQTLKIFGVTTAQSLRVYCSWTGALPKKSPSNTYSLGKADAERLHRTIQLHIQAGCLMLISYSRICWRFVRITDEWMEDYNHHRPH